MSMAYSAIDDMVVSRLQVLLADDDLTGLRAEFIGSRLVLVGSVPSYEAKCRIEKTAQTLALEIDSSLRVIPGAFADSLFVT